MPDYQDDTPPDLDMEGVSSTAMIRIFHVVVVSAVMTVALGNSARASGRATYTAHGSDETEIAIESVKIEDGYLKARVLLRSTKGPLRLKAGATFCDHLFQLKKLVSCDGIELPIVWGDCVGPAEGIDAPIILESGVWIGQDQRWSLGEKSVSCVHAQVQAFYDGSSARLPGPSIEFRMSKAKGLELVFGR